MCEYGARSRGQRVRVEEDQRRPLPRIEIEGHKLLREPAAGGMSGEGGPGNAR